MEDKSTKTPTPSVEAKEVEDKSYSTNPIPVVPDETKDVEDSHNDTESDHGQESAEEYQWGSSAYDEEKIPWTPTFITITAIILIGIVAFVAFYGYIS